MSLYDVLGVKRDASRTEIRAAYRKQASAHHPDREGGDGERMAEVNDAYATLINPETRAEYDATGKRAQDGHGGVAELIRTVFAALLQGDADLLNIKDSILIMLMEGESRAKKASADRQRTINKLRRIEKRLKKAPEVLDMLRDKIVAEEAALEGDQEAERQIAKAVTLVREWEEEMPDVRNMMFRDILRGGG